MTRPPELEQVPCGLCGSRRSRALFERPYSPDTFAGGDSFAASTDEFNDYGRIARCLDCGLVYTNPRPTRATLVRGYGESVDEVYAQEASSRSMNAHLSLSVIKRFAAGGRLLEVGASAGYFLNAARVDFEVAGLEPSAWACGIARRRFKLEVYPETLEECRRFEPASFDAVAMIDVIEHLCDPAAALKAAARLIKPGGLLYLVTPDIGSLSSRVLRGAWWGLRPAHITYFDKETMRRMLEGAGFEVVHAGSFGRIFTYGYWLSRLRHYPSFLYKTVARLIDLFDIKDKFLYINTRDSMEVCARRK